MKNMTSFGMLILVAGIIFGGMTSNASAQDDPWILLKIARHAQEQISYQISGDSSDKIKSLFKEGTQKVDVLAESLESNDIDSAQKHFFSAMKIFTEISRQLITSDTAPQAEINSLKSDAKDPSNDLERTQVHVNNLKTIAEKHHALIDFSELDELFVKARQQISDHQFVLAAETLHEIKETVAEIKNELREEASKQESQRAQEYAQKYLEQLDRLIENAKKQGVSDEIIQKLETAKENLILAENPSEIIKEIREIMSLKDKYELTKNDQLESRVLQIEKTLSGLFQTDGIDQDDLADAWTVLQSIKHHLNEGELDKTNELLKNLAKQIEEIKNSL